MTVIHLNVNKQSITPDIIKYIEQKQFTEIFIYVTLFNLNQTFHRDFVINIDSMPNCITKLIITCNGVMISNLDKLPSNLEELTLNSFGNNNNVAMLDNLPLTLKKLHINAIKFDQPLNYLPISLEVLIINSKIFDQSLDNLPSNLKTLYIQCEYFTKDLNNLPISLEMLAIINCNRYYDKNSLSLPKNLKVLSTNSIKDTKDLCVFPDTLEYLDIFFNVGGDKYIFQIENELPKSIKQLVVNKKVCLDYTKLPQTMESLVYIEDLYSYNAYLNLNDCFINNKLPQIYKYSNISIMNCNFAITIYNSCCYVTN
jgi:hypothetical protein